MRRLRAIYLALLAGCFVLAAFAGWTPFGNRFNNDLYDSLLQFTALPQRPTQAVLLGIDERSLSRFGGVTSIRKILADGLPRLIAAKPKAVVVDVILADAGEDAAVNERLASALAALPNVVLGTSLTREGQWEEPIELFRRHAAALGHMHADPDGQMVRRVSLEKVVRGKRYWAMSLEAFRLIERADIIETEDAIEVAGRRVRGTREQARPLWVQFHAAPVEEVSFADLADRPEETHARLAGKMVFVGATAQSLQDRYTTPLAAGNTPGVEIHAAAFETLSEGRILRPAGHLSAILFAALLTAAAGAIFWYVSGRWAYLAAGGLLLLATLAPWIALRAGIVYPYLQPLTAAWLAIGAAAATQLSFVRERLARAEYDKERYQQAIHFVAHEMRTPLSTIQGQSELMDRYSARLSKEKRAEMTRTINSESKRLARMIQTFLDVERLNEGQMELKRAPFQLSELLGPCVERVLPLAERKQMTIDAAEPTHGDAQLSGDRELMEYAVYNLLTNAIKYSPAGTRVTVTSQFDGRTVRLAVRDQGIGMDEQELRSIFRKFYRTRQAEQSGEAGTGIGLSIVDQIVTAHGGKMEVTSQPGAGSCFTMVIPATVAAVPPSGSAAEPVIRS
ncbi:MAG: CHASE2 domain-containing protein [Acidobacteria bacterium]|nr:CHASE2 domain-containing protein [Acidobacteriota bacterium]